MFLQWCQNIWTFLFSAQAPKRKAAVHSLLVEDEGSSADAAAAGTEDKAGTPAKKARMLDEIKKVFSPTKSDHVEIKEDDYDDDDDKPMIVDLKESDVVFTDYQDDDHSSQVTFFIFEQHFKGLVYKGQ